MENSTKLNETFPLLPASPHVPIWQIGTMPTSYAPLDEDMSVDVAIIGGGITGISTAAQLVRAGRSVVVLEARTIGSGTTGSSTGNLYATVDDRLHKLAAKWGAQRIAQVVESRSAAINLIERNVAEFRLDCDFSRQPWVLYTTEGLAEESADIEAEYRAALAAGLDARLALDLPLPYMIRKALVLRNQAQFHPLRYVQGLAAAIHSPQCRIHEQSAVTAIDPQAGVVSTARHEVRAATIVMATHVPKGFDMVQTELGPYREYAVAAPVERNQLPGGMFWNTGSKPTSARILQLGAQSYILMVGEKHKTGQNDDTLACYQILETRLQSRFHVDPVRFRWSAQHYRPADGLPYIGPSARHARLCLASGFAADGLVYGTLAGMIIANHLCDITNTYAELYAPGRFTPIKSARRFLRENLNIAGQYLRDHVAQPHQGLNELRCGEAAVIELDGARVAAFRDAGDQLHLLSAHCTHLNCIVHWNHSELSWDCPCHGSRFDMDGQVIEGPALMPLPLHVVSGTKSG